MQEITYLLGNGPDGSEGYYRDASVFTDEVLSETEGLAGEILNKFMSHMGEDPFTKPELRLEHGFELLVLGILWQVYSGDSAKLDEGPGKLLSGLSKMRAQGGALKPGIDFLRGIMSTLFLSPDLDDNLSISDLTPEHFDRLLNWLEATGEFNREVERLRLWQAYMETLGFDEAEDLLATAITLGVWFEGRSLEALGRYTANVETYLNEVRPGRYWREDVIFCGRRRVEYHMNMVGAEIMNRAYREGFLATSKKAVIIPACMRSLPSPECKAVSEGGAIVCRGCCSTCMANRLYMLGRQYGFEVLIIPHESSLSASKNEKPLLEKDTGVVGVACILNLVSGGWMMKNMGIPVQCVILDYCGCKNHWSRDGVPTAIDIPQLLKVLGKKAE